MGLREKYLDAVKQTQGTSYLRSVSTQLPYQANSDDTGAPRGGLGVNFMDGTARSQNNNTEDAFQTEFTRNEPGANVVGGAQGNVPDFNSNKLYINSRWKTKALELAFETTEGGPNSLTRGFWNTPRFRTSVVGVNTSDIHQYIPTNTKNIITGNTNAGYINKDTFANLRRNAIPTSR